MKMGTYYHNSRVSQNHRVEIGEATPNLKFLGLPFKHTLIGNTKSIGISETKERNPFCKALEYLMEKKFISYLAN